MFIKRFIAKDMQEAIKKIRKEFGADALILESKLVKEKGLRGYFKKKQFEVVAALEPIHNRSYDNPPTSKHKQKVKLDDTKSNNETNNETNMEMLNEQLATLKNTVQDFSNKILIANKETTLTLSSKALRLYNKLVEREVNEELAKDIALQAQEISNKKTVETSEIGEQIVIDRLGEPAQLKLKKYKQNIFLFAGPTGAGKTTTLAKLAGMLTYNHNMTVGLINMDTYRVGAIEHIKIYSEIMDIPLVTAYNSEELKDALESLRDREVILIDTAGKSSGDEVYKKELELYMKACHVDEVFLVLSIVTGYKACKDVISNFSAIHDFKLIITKLDEVNVWGNILNIADYAKKPISYVTSGQNVPEDISETDLQKIAENIIGEVLL